MKYHFGFKLLAIVLAACALIGALGACAITVANFQNNLFSESPEEVMQRSREDLSYTLANQVLRRYAAVNLGECTHSVLSYVNLAFSNEELSSWYDLDAGSWDYRICDLDGKVMESTYSGKISGDIETYTVRMSTSYPVHKTPEESALLENTTQWSYRDYYYTEDEEHFLYYYDSPQYVVTIRMLPNIRFSYYGMDPQIMQQLYDIRFYALAVLGTCLLIFALCLVYLCCAAGRSHRHNDIRLKGLTRLPLDIYGGGVFLACVALVVLGAEVLDQFYGPKLTLYDPGLYAGMGLFFAACILAVAYLYAFAAQLKMKGGTWWRRSLIGWCLRKLWQGIRFCFGKLRTLYRMLPLIWQWLLTAALMVIVPLFFLILVDMSQGDGFFHFLCVLWLISACLLDVAMVCYGAYAFGILLKGAKQMGQGDLNTKIPTKYLFGAFRDFARQLNTLADAAMVAAREQMKSERMKTELITNVSHDIKTPLTSLINYVDLLQKPHTQEEGQQYLEVLSRQSQRLKKLIDDLMDMSKASSGNMSVEPTQMDATEAVNQALGEYADKLESCQLTTVFRQPEQSVMMTADGRLTWRVMSNLLGNIVKYALPGTRVYVDLAQADGKVFISLKNISREALNVSADELTERFVRGDASRNTEGSGLGLNIAKSLMELQSGQLQLLVDGDLFKVTLVFPAA